MAAHSKRAELRQRCAAQRGDLGRAVADIEQRLQRVDHWLAATTAVATKPALLVGAVTTLFSMRRVGLWRTVGRGVMVWLAARRMLQWTKRG